MKIEQLIKAIDMHIFETSSDSLSLTEVVYELGTLHSKLFYTPNGTLFFYAFLYPEAIRREDINENLERMLIYGMYQKMSGKLLKKNLIEQSRNIKIFC